MTMFEWHAGMVERTASLVAHWVETTREDRLAWRPSAEEASDTRSVLDLAGECAMVNRQIAALLRGETPTPPQPRPAANAEEAKAELISSAQELAGVVRSLNEDALQRTYPTHYGPLPGAILMTLPLTNMMYHGGQINYIQRLYGDTEFHIPAFSDRRG